MLRSRSRAVSSCPFLWAHVFRRININLMLYQKIFLTKTKYKSFILALVAIVYEILNMCKIFNHKKSMIYSYYLGRLI